MTLYRTSVNGKSVEQYCDLIPLSVTHERDGSGGVQLACVVCHTLEILS